MIYILYTLLGSAIVAVAQTAGKLALRDLHPIKVCMFRFGLGAPVCYLMGVAQTHSWNPGLLPRQYLIISIIGIIAWGIGAPIFFWAMKMDTMHRVGTISNSLSIWAVVMSMMFLGEPYYPAMVPVLILLVAGVFLLVPATEGANRWKPAIPIGLLVSILWAVSIVMSKVAVRGVPYPTFVGIKMAATTLFLSFFYPFTPTRVTKYGFYYGLLSAMTLVAGDILLMAGVDGLRASVYSPLYSTTIPFGFIFSIVIIKEKPVRRNWLGMVLIFAAAAICGYFRPK